VVGQGLRVISGGCRNHPLQGPAEFLFERKNGIPGSTFLKRPGELPEFVLEVHVGANEFTDKGRALAGGADDAPANGDFGAGNVGKGNRQGVELALAYRSLGARWVESIFRALDDWFGR
jgi:hypothetical protein